MTPREAMNLSHLKECEGPRFAIRRFTITPEEAAFSMLRAATNGHCRYVLEGDYVKLVEKGVELWMSNTPAERNDHNRPLLEIQARGGNVLIMGLGLGMIVSAALACPNVERVVVVEIEPEVIELVGGQLNDPRLTIIEADATELTPKALFAKLGVDEGFRFSVAYADIWPSICTDDMAAHTAFRRRWARVSDVRICWVEQELQRIMARERRERAE